MQLEWDSRANPHQPRADWLERAQPSVSYTASAPTTALPPASLPSSLPAFAQRRRSSAAHIRPAGPPPNLPIPNLPSSSTTNLAPSSSLDAQDINPGSQQTNGRGTRSSSFNRPWASANLTAVANFSQIRQTASAPASQSPLQAATTQADDLADPPLPPALPPSSSRAPERSHDSGHSRHLSPPTTEHRPSSRRALTRALELAREAVQLDSTNEDPEAAVNAYAQSVALLSEVMERVKKGEDTTEVRRGRRRRSVAAQEEEVRRLQNIHDTYADRMNILSIIYSIPPAPYSTSALYSSVTRSMPTTQTNSPTNSRLSSSENSPQILQVPYTNHLRDEAQYNVDDYARHELGGAQEPIGSPITLDESVLITGAISGLPLSSSQHPYAAPYTSIPQPPESTPVPAVRAPSVKARPRTPSQLPLPHPPPSNSLPQIPNTASAEPSLDVAHSLTPPRAELNTRAQPEHGTHSLLGTGLTTLEEEGDDGKMDAQPYRDGDGTHGIALDTPRNLSKREEHPLPPTPSPTDSSRSSGTPRTSLHVTKPPSSPRLATAVPSRPRGTASSQAPPRSEPPATPPQPAPIISSTIAQGTIHQRRTKSSLTSATSRSASPTEAAPLTRPTQKQSQPQSATSTSNVQPTRNRSSSQPGHRPSIIMEPRPPLPPPVGSNPLPNRKPSFPTKLLPNHSILTLPQPGELISSPQVGTPAPPFFTLPSMSLGVVPFTPASPLPPAPPSDPLRQPYHMMNLLATSMTSSSGGYITRRLHVPNDVWCIPGVKLSNIVEKIRVLEILSGALEDVQLTSSEYFGAGNVSSGMAMGIGSIGGKEANAWLAKLDEFSSICDGVVANFGKKLGVGEGFVLKKTTWGDKLSRRFDKFTNGKNLDSPMAYMSNLRKLFLHVQLLDEHTKAVLSQPIAPAYAAFPIEIRVSAEQKLKRASEFFASVVLTFVIRDLALLLDKYVKKCERVLED